MAKSRRIIRKVPKAQDTAFDDQMWPVDVALIILGAFLAGAVLAYLRFDTFNVFTNAITYLLLIPMVVGGSMVGLRYVGNRLVRRTMQLALIISVMVHLIFLILAINVMIFSRIFPEIVDVRDLITPRQVVLPDYHPSQTDPQEQPRDHERPVETETPQPEPEPEEVEREQTEPEEARTEPQPTPVPEPEQTVEPTVVRRETTAEATPRQNEQQSKMSRQMVRKMERPNQTATPVETPRQQQQTPSQSQAQNTQVARQNTQVNAQRQAVETEPLNNNAASTSSGQSNGNRTCSHTE